MFASSISRRTTSQPGYTNATLQPIQPAHIRRASAGEALLGAVRLLTGPITSVDISQSENSPPEPTPQFIRLNIGGMAYCLSAWNVFKRGEKGLLFKFFTSSHKVRLNLCDNYFEKTEEYYFERPSKFFDPIYAYYTTGMCYRPGRNSINMFFSELSYWGLTKVFFPEINKDDNHNESMALKRDFAKVPFGNVRRRVWNLFEVPESSVWAKVIAIISVTAVLVSNMGLVLGSMDQFQITRNITLKDPDSNQTNILKLEEPLPVFEYVERLCIVFFTIEYSAKMLVAYDRKTIFLQPANLIDLIAILPFYVELLLMLTGLDSAQMDDFHGVLLVMRILRISRVIRLFKLGRHSLGLQLVASVMKQSIFQLGMVAVSAVVALVFFSTLIYFTEKDQPDTKFTSIPHSFWWAVVSMTTVGYGDMYPETTGGKLVATCAIAVGVLVCALPITVMVDNFVQVQQEFKEIKQTIERSQSYNNTRETVHHGYKGSSRYHDSADHTLLNGKAIP